MNIPSCFRQIRPALVRSAVSIAARDSFIAAAMSPERFDSLPSTEAWHTASRGKASVYRWGLVLLFLLFAGVWFGSLGFRSLIHTDEGRYAALALEMARSGDWITP